jgi:hypothetical protein
MPTISLRAALPRAQSGAPPLGTAAHAQCHLTQADLAHRWRISERTLERWRWRKTGPCYVKLGGRVVYRLKEVLEFEVAQRRAPSPAADPFFRNVR